MNHLNVWAWLKKRARFYYYHRPIGSQNHCEDEDVLGHSSSSHSLCTVEMNEQYRSTTSLKNLVDDANKKSYEYEAYYDTQRSYDYESEQDNGTADNVTSEATSMQIAYSMGGASVRLASSEGDNMQYNTGADYDRDSTVLSVSLGILRFIISTLGSSVKYFHKSLFEVATEHTAKSSE